MQIVIQKVWAGAVDSAIPSSSQVMVVVMPAVWSPVLEEEGFKSFEINVLFSVAEIISNDTILNLAFFLITLYLCRWNPIENLKM